jgi:phosphoribosyl 1,2-cyclic phosphodiesterase
MIVKFWGVRGSIPTPGIDTAKYGGNTVCIEIKFADIQRRIIIDAGSGLRLLGNHLMAKHGASKALKTDIFLTHTHLDHILGFPFFAPIFLPSTRLKIYGPVTCETESLETVIGGQLSYRYFPIRQQELAAQIDYLNLTEGCFDLGDDIRLTTKYLNHPLLCLGFRFEYNGNVCCTAYDTEPFQNLFVTDAQDPAFDAIMAHQGEVVAKEENDRLEAFFAGADLLIHDAQYTQQEYEPSRRGWGHSPVEYAIKAAQRSNVKHLALFHHDPMRTDTQLDELTKLRCHRRQTGDTEVFFAREGMQVEI